MPKPATTRLGLPQYEDSEVASFSAQVNAISKALDLEVSIFLKGKFSARPAAGIEGRYYLAEDGVKSGCSEGDLYYDTGTAWVGPRNSPTQGPLGGMMDYPLATDPVDPDGTTRWMIANGRAISRVTYKVLFEKINAEGLLKTWGEGNGSTTFNIPNTIGAVAVHPGGSGVTLGVKGGEQTHKLTEAELAAHSHGGATGGTNLYLPDESAGHLHEGAAQSYGAQPGYTATDNILFQGHSHAISSAGGGTAHNNMQPYLGLYKLIRVL